MNSVQDINIQAKNDSAQKHTIRRKIVLGKSKTQRSIGVLISDTKTRENISSAKKILKTAKIRDVKKYLRHHGLVRSGSSAPHKILRDMYETVTMTGDVFNKDKEILMQNCLSEKDDGN